jgi:glycosyltransferase involved in cell wall biosynthesis
VVTIHDLAPLEHPEWFRTSFVAAYGLLLPGLVRQAAGLIAVSQHTKIRIQEYFQISPRKICVIPGGVDIRRFQPASVSRQAILRERYGIPGDYVLFVGTRAPHKNLTALLNTWNELSSRYSGLVLVLAGGVSGVHREDPTKNYRDTSHSHIISLDCVPEADLPAMYSGACAYVQPSLSEGFGLTVLEAMACGVPVLASCKGGLPETAGNCAVIFDPDEPGDLTCQLDRLLGNSVLRANLRLAGFHRAATFSWERSAASTRSFMDDVAEGLG